MLVKKIIMTFTLLMPCVAFAASSGTCMVSTTPVNFGSYDVFSNSAVDTVGQVTVGCTGVGTTYSVTVQLNKGLVGSVAQRKMQQGNGNDKLSYNLYTDAGRSTIWGDGTSSSSTQTINVNGGTSSTLSIYGRIPALQDVEMGSYTDSITVTINF